MCILPSLNEDVLEKLNIFIVEIGGWRGTIEIVGYKNSKVFIKMDTIYKAVFFIVKIYLPFLILIRL